MKTTVLFDLDGTLINSMPCHYKAASAVFRHSDIPCPPFEEFLECLQPPFDDFYTSRGVSISHDEIWRLYREAFDDSVARLFPETRDTLARLGERKVRMGILSANDIRRVRFLRRVGELLPIRHHFSVIRAGVMHKTASITALLKRGRVSLEDACYVGDMPSDMLHAKGAGIVAIGVTRGCARTRARLMGAGADLCIDDLSELVTCVR